MKSLLLSGGMDSIAMLYWKRPDIALTIDYGQNAAKTEISASKYACEVLDIEHKVISIDCSILGYGDMSQTDSHKNAPESDWWPYRNQMLITFGAMYLLQFNVQTIYIASVKSDKQFKDGTNKFTNLINDLICYQEGNIKIEAPAIEYTTKELIKISEVPSSILMCAHSCHTGNIPCGKCRGCNKYISIFDSFT